MKLYCIINPYAGKGITGRLWPEVKKNLDKLSPEITYDFTQYPGHASTLARDIKRIGVDGVIAVGGDGTINEVINGLVDSNLPLGIIPTGTGNDLSRTLGIPQDPFEAVIILAQAKLTEINLGEVNGTYFVNVASVGFDAAVAGLVNKRRFLKGKAAYYGAILLNIIRNRHYNLSISLDGNIIEKKCTLVAIANGKYYGAGQKIAPQADYTDDLFDVVIIASAPRVDILKTLPGIKDGRHLRSPYVNIYKAKIVTVSSGGYAPAQADGELLEGLPQTFKISEKKLKIFMT